VLRLVGIGPGSVEDRTERATQAISASKVIVGYGPYLERINDLLEGKELYSSGMKKESERVFRALELAAGGAGVALISSGDAGVYGMAGLALEMKEREFAAADIKFEIIPGVTAACSAAAKLGAPLMLDYANISLSDLLVPLEKILKRLEAALVGGFVIVLYNPKSRSRTEPFARACELFEKYLPPETPVGIVSSIGLADENVQICAVASLAQAEIGMKSTVIVGNADCRIIDGWLVNPRGYFS